jgi:hypothetical protein
MTPDEELMVIFGALHVVALVLGVILFMMFLRSDSTSSWKPPEDDEGGGGGGNDRLPTSKPKPRPTGGVPLPDADPRARGCATTPSCATPIRAHCGAPLTRTRRSALRRAGADPQQALSSPIGSESASSVTPPPVSGPSRRTRTHWTTGSPFPARHATRPVPVWRVSESWMLGW